VASINNKGEQIIYDQFIKNQSYPTAGDNQPLILPFFFIFRVNFGGALLSFNSSAGLFGKISHWF
jgi:hypothetical protein